MRDKKMSLENLRLEYSNEKIGLENLRFEYSEVNNNRRHYSNLRFAVFSVFFAVLGGLVSVSFGVVDIKSPSEESKESIVFWARVAGLLFTVIFFSLEILCDLNIRHFTRVAEKLEADLGYQQFRTKKFRYFPKALYFTWSMYGSIIIFWIVSVWRGV